MVFVNHQLASVFRMTIAERPCFKGGTGGSINRPRPKDVVSKTPIPAEDKLI